MGCHPSDEMFSHKRITNETSEVTTVWSLDPPISLEPHKYIWPSAIQFHVTYATD
jgi:hypothetical protein